MQIRTIPNNRASAFALPAVILISTGVLILLVALMTIVELERTTSKARVGSYQADLAVESGFEEAKMILAGATASDTYSIATIPFVAEYDDNNDGSITPEEDAVLDLNAGEKGRPYLYAIQGETDGNDPLFRLTPLFATHEGPGTEQVDFEGKLSLPEDPGLSLQQENNLENRVSVTGPPHLQAPVTAWRTVRDQEGVPIARYSYWVEDMQGYLDSEYVPGNARLGQHARANEKWEKQLSFWERGLGQIARKYLSDGGTIPLWPAPGLNPGYQEEAEGFLNPENRLLSDVAIYTLDESQVGTEDKTQFDDIMRSISPRALTPATLLALNGAEAPIERVPTGPDRGRIDLVSGTNAEENRLIEENFTTGNRAWEEQALVPFTPGIAARSMGRPRLNLNKLLEDASRPSFGGFFSPAENAISEMASFIDNALPNFSSERKGGFPEDYARTLAANALDYADLDSQPNIKEGIYRGVDSHPLISEYTTTLTWRWVEREVNSPNASEAYAGDSFLRTNGNLYLLMTVELHAELWNMSNHAIEGQVEFSYENNYEFPALGNPGITFMGDVLENTGGPGAAASFSSHSLQKKDDGFYYTPQRSITLQPNEYLLVPAGVVRYGFYVGGDGAFMPQPIPTIDGDEGNSQYRMRWNNQLCDRTMGGLERPSFTKLRTTAPKTKANISGTWGPFGSFFTGMQDPRQSWWAGLNTSNPGGMVSENSYPGNFTPGRRNVRFGSLGGRPNEPFARTLPSEWPDGGHDSSFNVRDFRSKTTSDRTIKPNDSRFIGGPTDFGRGGMWLEPEQSKAPMFLSNLGRFFSETEWGNVYDPIMWKGRLNPGQSTETWPYRELNFAEEPQVSLRATEAKHVGGGNTLRIGRPEHEKFTQEPGTRASRLLDLFHCGVPLSSDKQRRNGGIRVVEGHINVNTAPRNVLRTLLAGKLMTDLEIGRELPFDTSNTFAPRHFETFGEVSASDVRSSGSSFADEAGIIADAIIAGRPYVSLSQLADLTYPDDLQDPRLRGRPVFGNKFNHSLGTRLQRTDRAAEEVFSRIYNSSTVRSRNFRIHVIGQALEQTPSGNLRVKATRKKSFRVFANAGSRDSRIGTINPANLKIETLYETNL